jgi:hypothetical protein
MLLALTVLPLLVAIVAAGPLHSFRERGFLVAAAAPWLLVVAGVALGPWRGRFQILARIVLGIGLAAATVMGLQYHRAEQKEDWRAAAGLVALQADSSDPVFFVHFGSQVAFDRYFAGPQPRVGLPGSFDWDSGYTAPYRVTPADVEQRVPPALEGRRAAWVVLSHDAGRGSSLLVDYLDRRATRLSDVRYRGVRVLWYRLPDDKDWVPQPGGCAYLRRMDCGGLAL